MTTFTHIAIAGAIGEKIQNPFLAYFAGILSHLVLDKVPHYWPESDKAKGYIIGGDTVFSVFLLSGIYFLPSSNHLGLFCGALGGATVDAVFVLLLRSKGKLAEWHTKRQLHKVEPCWILTDVLLTVIGLVAIWMWH